MHACYLYAFCAARLITVRILKGSPKCESETDELRSKFRYIQTLINSVYFTGIIGITPSADRFIKYFKLPDVNCGSSKSIHYKIRWMINEQERRFLCEKTAFLGRYFHWRDTFCESLVCNKRVSKRSDNFRVALHHQDRSLEEDVKSRVYRVDEGSWWRGSTKQFY